MRTNLRRLRPRRPEKLLRYAIAIRPNYLSRSLITVARCCKAEQHFGEWEKPAISDIEILISPRLFSSCLFL